MVASVLWSPSKSPMACDGSVGSVCVKIQAAPMLLSSRLPPAMAVRPSDQSARAPPCCALIDPLTAPVPTSLLPSCDHAPLLRTNAHDAPALVLSAGPPSNSRLPLLESETCTPCRAPPADPVPTSFEPCCVQVVPLRVKIHTAPAKELSW